MTGFGIVMVYSASSAVAELRYHVPPYYFVLRQIGWAVASFLVLMYFKRFDYRRLNTPTWAFSGLGIVIALLVLVYFVDSRSHRWFKIGGLGSFQPSEFAKPALILFLAYFISRRAQVINYLATRRQALLAVVMLGAPGCSGGSGNRDCTGADRDDCVLGGRPGKEVYVPRRDAWAGAVSDRGGFERLSSGTFHRLLRSRLSNGSRPLIRIIWSASTLKARQPSAMRRISLANRKLRWAPAASWVSD